MRVPRGAWALVVPLLAACTVSSETAPAVVPPPVITTGPTKPVAALHLADAVAAIEGSVGIAVMQPSGIVAAGTWVSGDAWSTSKVTVTIAALNESASAKNRAYAQRAITESNNVAAQALWDSMGAGTSAAAKTDAVLRSLGDSATRTNPDVTRSGYSAFGQTQWSLADQARVASHLPCSAQAKITFGLMGHIVAHERWGLGRWNGAHFKGGWGPDGEGRYLVRQFGVLPLRGGWVPIAVAVVPSDGKFSTGTALLSQITRWLHQHQDRLRPVTC